MGLCLSHSLGMACSPEVSGVAAGAWALTEWPREWAYMIRIEEIGKPPELLMTILDRGSLNPQDISTRISPKAIML